MSRAVCYDKFDKTGQAGQDYPAATPKPITMTRMFK